MNLRRRSSFKKFVLPATPNPLQSIRLMLLTLFFLVIPPVISSQPSEYMVKAVALEKLTLFIEWPEEQKTDTDQPFIITVLEPNPMREALKEVYKNHKIKGKTVKIKTIQDIRELDRITPCHVLFIPELSLAKLAKVLETTRKKPVLTIADVEGYASLGCDLNFYFNSEGKLRFEINQEAMKADGFTIDFKLLNLAKVVNTGKM